MYRVLVRLFAIIALATPSHAQPPTTASKWTLVQGGDGAGLYVDLATAKATPEHVTADFLGVAREPFSEDGRMIDAEKYGMEVDCKAKTLRTRRSGAFGTDGRLLFDDVLTGAADRVSPAQKHDPFFSVCFTMPTGSAWSSAREAVAHARSKADTGAALKVLTLPEGDLLLIGGNSATVNYLIADRIVKNGDVVEIAALRIWDPAVASSGKAIVQSVMQGRIECSKRVWTLLNEANFSEAGEMVLYMPRTAAEPAPPDSAYGMFASVVCDGVKPPSPQPIKGNRTAIAVARQLLAAQRLKR